MTTTVKRGYRRMEILERHAWRTGLLVDRDYLLDASIAVLGRADDIGDGRELLQMLGLIHPAGPAKVGMKVVGDHAGFRPVPNAHRKRAKS